MKCGVYRIKCLINGYFYVGSSCNMEKRIKTHLRSLQRQCHHNIFLQRVFNKYGRESFTVRFKETDGIEAARKLEQKYLDLYSGLKRCMNIGISASGGDNLTLNPNRKNIIKRMIKSVRRRVDSMTPEERKSVYGRSGKQNPMYGKTHTKEAREIISKRNKNNTYAVGAVRSEETKQLLRDSIKRKQEAGTYVNAFQGKKHSIATKRKLSAMSKARVESGILPSNTLRIRVGKKIYRSANVAAKHLGCKTATVLNRARNPKFPDYHILD